MSATESFDVVVYGGGHAGAVLAKSLQEKLKVALVDQNDYTEVSSAVVRNLVEPGFAKNAAVSFKTFLHKAKFIHGRLVELNSDGSGRVALNDGAEVTVKGRAVVLATGLRYKTSAPRAYAESTRASRLEFYEKFANAVKTGRNIVIAGGGPIGVEFAAEIVEKYGAKSKSVTIVNSTSRILSSTKESVTNAAMTFLVKRGVKVINSVRVDEAGEDPTTPGTAVLSNGEKLPYDVFLWANGGKPHTDYMEKNWAASLNSKGEIKVDPYFIVQNNKGPTAVFAFGDVAALNEPKLAWLVGDMIKIAENNVQQKLTGSRNFKQYNSHPNDPRMGVTLGKDNGVFEVPYMGTIKWGWFARMMKSRDMFVPKFRKDLGV